MAQSGYTPILIYGSGTASNIPSAANLTSSANGAELALNYADGKLYYKNSAGTVTLLADQNAVTVATANGFGGTIAKATSTTTPAITIRTSVTGVLVGNGTAVAAAVSGTDFKTINSTSILGSGNISITSTPGGATTQVQYNSAGAFAGSANFVFDGTNVGIGTSSPTYKLNVVGTNGGTTGLFQVGINAVTNGFTINTDASNNIVYSFLTKTGSTGIYQDASGNVGIGTSSPTSRLTIGTGAYSAAASGTTGMYTVAAGLEVLSDSYFFGTRTGGILMLLNSSGNLGLGVTPSAWSGVGAALQVGVSAAIIGNSASSSSFISNAYFDGTNYRYIGTGFAQRLALTSGAYAFQTAASGTAGNTISFTQAMTLDASGNLGVGTTSWPSTQRLRVAGGDVAFEGQFLYLVNANADIQMGAGQNSKITNTDSTNTLAISRTGASSIITLSTAGSERMRIDSSGNVGIGVTPPTVSQGRLLSLAYSGSGISVTSGTSLDLTNNAYYNTAWKYGQTGKTARLQLSDDLFIFYNATTGTAGNNITFSERARISAAGGFSVGTTADPGAGAIYATGAITAFYSDRRLKDVKGTIANALDKVSSLSGVYYTNNEVAVAHGYTSAETQVGLLAQDVEAVLPEVVKAAPFDLDEKGNSKSGEHYKTIQYERVIPLLVEAIKELRAEIQTLRG